MAEHYADIPGEFHHHSVEYLIHYMRWHGFEEDEMLRAEDDERPTVRQLLRRAVTVPLRNFEILKPLSIAMHNNAIEDAMELFEKDIVEGPGRIAGNLRSDLDAVDVINGYCMEHNKARSFRLLQAILFYPGNAAGMNQFVEKYADEDEEGRDRMLQELKIEPYEI